jgi:hypothetical protein
VTARPPLPPKEALLEPQESQGALHNRSASRERNIHSARARLVDSSADGVEMVKRVTLDAMIRRADFAVVEGEAFELDRFQGFQLNNLTKDSPILKLLRKPDFQRETNHWTPEQICTFIESFLDNEVIPSLILWQSNDYIFVIDGGHRLSALRAWIEDDYGDRNVSLEFYKDEISTEQKQQAKKSRSLIEDRIGRFSTLAGLVGSTTASEQDRRRANRMFTRTVSVQWIQGSASYAETSFFKINSQGTPLDEVEEMLIRNRRKPIAIGARAILRAGTGHKYWSAFEPGKVQKIEQLAGTLFQVLFEPEMKEPPRTIDVPIGGTTSPVDALALLIEFLELAGSRDQKLKTIAEHPDDETGDQTIRLLTNALEVVNRMVGNSSPSLGLHPAVYFYTERAKYSTFLFLGMSLLLSEKLRNNDDGFFKKFTKARSRVEKFLIEQKSVIGVILRYLGRPQRILRMRDMIQFLADKGAAGQDVTPEQLVQHLGMRGRVVEFMGAEARPQISTETRASVLLAQSLANALVCPECSGKLHPSKSVSYDHIKRIREGGTGALENVQMMHPFCNSAMKS